MSDSSFPSDDEGLDPYLGQDLDGLLSGENCCVPEALKPVIPTLDALRAAPVQSELLGEATARAYFREIMLAGESAPARPNAGAGEARTLILRTGTSGGLPRRHRHRRPPLGTRRQAAALAGVAAAAVVIVGAAALAGTFSSSGGHPAVAGGSQGAVSPAGPATGLGSHGVDGNGTPDPSVKPTSKTSTSQQSGEGPSPRDLCREYFDFLADPGRYASPATEHELLQRLSSLADGQGGIASYCMRLLQPWAAPPQPGDSQGMPGPQNPQGTKGSQGSDNPQGSQGAGSSSGQGGSGSNVSGKAGSGSA